MILIMGLPGAGKSVQSELIQERLGFHWLSTGKLFRETEDPEIKAIMTSGALVSDEQTSRMVGDKLKQIGYDSTFLLDGFPRNEVQARWLYDHMEEVGKHVQLILYLVVDPAVSAERLGSRGRADDSEEAQKKRLEEARKIQPAIDYMHERGVPVVRIDANGTVEEIFEQIKSAVGEHI